MAEQRASLRDVLRPAASLVSGMLAVLLCANVIYLSSWGSANNEVAWTGGTLLAGIAALALGVLGIEAGRRGRLAFVGSLLVVAGIVAVWLLGEVSWARGL